MKEGLEYIGKSAASLVDKLQFMSIIDSTTYDVVVDFGCNNADLIYFASQLRPDLTFIGYDINENSIKLARNRFKGCRNIVLTTSWRKVTELTKGKENRTVLNISSVLHEAFSKGLGDDVLEKITSNKYRYISVRDMMKRGDYPIKDLSITDIPSNYVKYYYDYTSKRGKIDTISKFFDFGIKTLYLNDWDYEMKENYFSVDASELDSYMIDKGYGILSDLGYSIPYIRSYIKNNFSICDNYYGTHTFIIYDKECLFP